MTRTKYAAGGFSPAAPRRDPRGDAEMSARVDVASQLNPSERRGEDEHPAAIEPVGTGGAMAHGTTVSGDEAVRTITATGRRRDFWAIVLAGGEGVRLRPLVRRALG